MGGFAIHEHNVLAKARPFDKALLQAHCALHFVLVVIIVVDGFDDEVDLGLVELVIVLDALLLAKELVVVAARLLPAASIRLALACPFVAVIVTMTVGCGNRDEQNDCATVLVERKRNSEYGALEHACARVVLICHCITRNVTSDPANQAMVR